MHDLKIFIFETEWAKQFKKLEKQSKCIKTVKNEEKNVVTKTEVGIPKYSLKKFGR